MNIMNLELRIVINTIVVSLLTVFSLLSLRAQSSKSSVIEEFPFSRFLYIQLTPHYGKLYKSTGGFKNIFSNKLWSYQLSWSGEIGLELPLRNQKWILATAVGYNTHRTKDFFGDYVIQQGGYYLKTGLSKQLGENLHIGFYPWLKWIKTQTSTDIRFGHDFTDYNKKWYGANLLLRWQIDYNFDLLLGLNGATSINSIPISNRNGIFSGTVREIPVWLQVGVRAYPWLLWKV